MRIHITPNATVLTLCLSLAAASAFAGDVPAAPQSAPAALVPVGPPPQAPAPAVPAAAPSALTAPDVSPAPGAPPASGTPPAPSTPDTPPAPADFANPPNPSQRDEAAVRARMEAARRREEAAMRAVNRSERATEQREAALRTQMEAARRRLEVAAQQLAALSAQMNGPMMERVEMLAGPPHVLLGVQLGDSHGHVRRHSGMDSGAVVREVSPGGAAERAGVRAGDRIVAVNGTSVSGNEPALRVVELLHGVKPGDKVDLRISRAGSTREVTVVAHPAGDDFFFARQLPGMPAMPGMPAVPAVPGMPAMPAMPELSRMRALAQWGGAPMIFGGPVADMELARLTPGLGRYFGTDAGVLVVRAPPDGGLGLQDGDVILSIGGRAPVDSSHAIRILGSYDPGEKFTLEVMRQHHRISFATTLPAQSRSSRRLMEIPKGVMQGPGPVVRLGGDGRTL